MSSYSISPGYGGSREIQHCLALIAAPASDDDIDWLLQGVDAKYFTESKGYINAIRRIGKCDSPIPKDLCECLFRVGCVVVWSHEPSPKSDQESKQIWESRTSVRLLAAALLIAAIVEDSLNMAPIGSTERVLRSLVNSALSADSEIKMAVVRLLGQVERRDIAREVNVSLLQLAQVIVGGCVVSDTLRKLLNTGAFSDNSERLRNGGWIASTDSDEFDDVDYVAWSSLCQLALFSEQSLASLMHVLCNRL